MNSDSQPGHVDQIKQTNAGVVYRLIDHYGPVSRIELARLAQLAPASITKIIREMVDAHLVTETQYAEPGSRGRPATGLVLDTAGWHFLALRLHQNTVTITLRDLSTQTLVEEQHALPHDGQQPLLAPLTELIEAFFTRHQQRLERLTAIAITLPGLSHNMPESAAHELPLAQALTQHTGLPVFIQQEVSAWTLAESLFGAAFGATEVIQLVVDDTVGAGIICDGQLLHKKGRARVEIGHIQVEAQGALCSCGHRGCLETVVSRASLLRLLSQRLPFHPESLLNTETLSLEALCNAALQGDGLATGLITQTGEHLGRMLATLVNIFHPQHILLGSPLNAAATLLYPAIVQALRQHALPAYHQQLQLSPTAFPDPGTLGAAALIKDAMYNGSLLVRLLQG
ncbi:sugar metabolism global transcriptional regulator Mlc [Pantoea sp. A4]|uniref:sugar metabolism global transcriptional regulator Mlc n=1 Tax=Pantoea sp. A4 TaxID=1225184 RepID=UPI000371E5E4|nr:ROK family protein [Pantoea sp. A4]